MRKSEVDAGCAGEPQKGSQTSTLAASVSERGKYLCKWLGVKQHFRLKFQPNYHTHYSELPTIDMQTVFKVQSDIVPYSRNAPRGCVHCLTDSEQGSPSFPICSGCRSVRYCVRYGPISYPVAMTH